ncbi:MAG: hypothetical protein L6W00_24690 [Lentisphaeria bacterium]|nr:MAG: hypothetical protein L6W00_24690 [Lentisphaeria bacterium]
MRRWRAAGGGLAPGGLCGALHAARVVLNDEEKFAELCRKFGEKTQGGTDLPGDQGRFGTSVSGLCQPCRVAGGTVEIEAKGEGRNVDVNFIPGNLRDALTSGGISGAVRHAVRVQSEVFRGVGGGVFLLD